MAATSDIIIRQELRACIVYGMHGLFHKWTDRCTGIVEFEDGTVSEVNLDQIRFCDDAVKGYAWQE